MRILILYLLLVPIYSQSQKISAAYNVQDQIIFENGKVLNVEKKGFLFRKNNKYIYFEKPAYLDKYPGGEVQEEDHTFLLTTDSIINIQSVDLDSMIKRYRNETSFNESQNYYFEFERDFYEWSFSNEKKMINGLECQKASFTVRGNPQWEVWFTPSIPMDGGIGGIVGLPGLVVEAKHLGINTTYVLESYDTRPEIDDKVFWPAEFCQPFIKRNKLLKSNKN